MKLERLEAGQLDELETFYRALSIETSRDNLRQFAAPLRVAPGFEVVTLVMRDVDRIAGTIGWIDVPFQAGARTLTLRWPISHFLLPEYQGRGLGRQLMDATREGVALRAAIGGTESSMPVRDTGRWRLIGHLVCARWARPNLRLSRMPDRLRLAARAAPPSTVTLRSGSALVVARRVERFTGWLPWLAGEASLAGMNPGAPGVAEAHVPRTAQYLEFAFQGPLREHFTIHSVTVSGLLSGYFVLSARSDRHPLLTTEILDIGSIAGRETSVLRAARQTALACSDVVRLRVCGERFTGPLRRLVRAANLTQDLAVRVAAEPGEDLEAAGVSSIAAIASWHLTYGDHDQYRLRANSVPWAVAHEEERSSR